MRKTQEEILVEIRMRLVDARKYVNEALSVVDRMAQNMPARDRRDGGGGETEDPLEEVNYG